MPDDHLHRLMLALMIVFIGPAIGYLLGKLWGNFVDLIFGGHRSATDIRLDKAWKTFCLGLSGFLLGVVLVKDYANLRLEWERYPYSGSIAALVFVVIVPFLLLAAIVRVWRSEERFQ